jgi:tetratricopeptide (TPR) repeat protein
MLALKNRNEGFKKYTIVSSFFIALSLWMVMFAYNPSHALYFLTFVFTGIFFGSSLNSNLIRLKEYNLGKQSFLSKVMWLAPFAGVLVVIVWGLIYVKKVIAITYFQKGIKEISTGKSVDNAEKYFTSSNKWDTYDVYYQALSEVSILKINNFTQEFNAKQVKPTEKEVASVSTMINNGIDNSKKAIEFDPTNYYNYTSLARVADVAASLKVANAYENSRGAYIEALKYNPANPAIYLSLAKLDAVNGKIDEAKQNIQRSLILKQDYTDAVFLLSQIQTQNGEIANAIESTKVATQIEPSNSVLFFQLGILYYNNKDYKNAVESLNKAVSLNSQYANARYFLGLAYARLNDDKNAIIQFEELAKTNPDNQEVALILSNLKLGKSPFSDAKPPIDSKPEKRSKLPVTEKTSTSGSTSSNTTTKKSTN